VPETDVLAQLTGLTIDGWVFAANDALHVALGASPEAIGTIAAAEATHEGASDGLQAYLPEALTSALAANQVSMITHIPLDAMHSPQTHELIKTALKNVEEVKPDLVLAFFDLAAPLSSGTMWITHNADTPQLHMAFQAFGHHADDEGKAALAAAAAVASGADPASTYATLVSNYPDSPRIASYKIRAGESPAALVASGFGAFVAAGALAFPVIEGQRNEAIAEELEIEQGAADKAKEESKKQKPKTVPKKEDKKKEEKKEDKAPENKEETKPSGDDGGTTPPTPSGDGGTTPPTPSGDGDTKPSGDEGAPPKPPAIIPEGDKGRPERAK